MPAQGAGCLHVAQQVIKKNGLPGHQRVALLLLERLGRNMVADTASLICRKAGGDPKGFFRIDMKKVRIRSINMKVGEGTGVTPVETVVLSFQKITWTYKEQSAQGTLQGDVFYEHDIAANR